MGIVVRMRSSSRDDVGTWKTVAWTSGRSISGDTWRPELDCACVVQSEPDLWAPIVALIQFPEKK